jgi:hypothetical protein
MRNEPGEGIEALNLYQLIKRNRNLKNNSMSDKLPTNELEENEQPTEEAKFIHLHQVLLAMRLQLAAVQATYMETDCPHEKWALIGMRAQVAGEIWQINEAIQKTMERGNVTSARVQFVHSDNFTNQEE